VLISCFSVGGGGHNGCMNDLGRDLTDLQTQLRAVVAGMFQAGIVADVSDRELADAVTRTGEIARLVDALLIEQVSELTHRSDTFDRADRLTTRMGCHDVNELVQRLTRCGPQTAARLVRARTAVGLRWDGLGGIPRPARFPGMRAVMIEGEAGLDGVLAVAGPLLAMRDRATPDEVAAADTMLAAAARGDGPDGAPPACADLLRVQAQVWATVLDQDGSEPQERETVRHRSATLGRPRDGIVPLRADLLPDVAAQLQRIFDATCSPRVRFGDPGEEDVDIVDDRTRPQKQHDALANALTVAAASGKLPTIGGAAPTLLVSVREEDLREGRGWGDAEGCDQPVPLPGAVHVGCAGVIQRVLTGKNGRILSIGTEERVFNRHQRRAITLRDGGCIIPGCGIPAGWCEIHHVHAHAHGGPTHTDNGVLLCWAHHRFIDTGPWRIRMNHGTPEIQAPHWFDPTHRWRTTTKSHTRLQNLTRRRT
jgi:hypothetical protein